MISDEIKRKAKEIAKKRVEANLNFYTNTFRQRDNALETEFKGILAELLARQMLEENGIEYEAAEFVQERVTNKPDLIANGIKIDIKGGFDFPKVNKQTAEKTEVDLYVFFIFDKLYSSFTTIRATPYEVQQWELVTINQNNQYYHMTDKLYFGNGWEDQYGMNISINIKAVQEALESGKLEMNSYGDIKLRVGKRQAPHEKSKATHFICNQKPKDLPF